MPLVRISTLKTYSEAQLKTIGELVYETMQLVLRVPVHDNFQVLTRHDENELIFDRQYLSIERSEGFVMIQITLNNGRSSELKQSFYKHLADSLFEKLSIRHEDVFINLVEVNVENWSFGNGIAQYASQQ